MYLCTYACINVTHMYEYVFCRLDLMLFGHRNWISMPNSAPPSGNLNSFRATTLTKLTSACGLI